MDKNYVLYVGVDPNSRKVIVHMNEKNFNNKIREDGKIYCEDFDEYLGSGMTVYLNSENARTIFEILEKAIDWVDGLEQGSIDTKFE
jgi:hypothetical protein